MAGYIGQALGTAVKPLTSGALTSTRGYQVARYAAGKLHRASIYYRQENSFNYTTDPVDKPHREDMGFRENYPIGVEGYTSEPGPIAPKTRNFEPIFFVDMDFDQARDSASRVTDRIQLTSVPKEVDFDPDTNLVGLFSIARNNPRYHFTGAEDTVTIELDWFADSDHMGEVIFSCRWLEMMSKGNGYDDTIHRVKIVWGKDDILWKDYQFVIASAPYKLKDWNAGYMRDGEFISTKMVPRGATQTITLKRISDTNMTSDIMLGKLKRTR